MSASKQYLMALDNHIAEGGTAYEFHAAPKWSQPSQPKPLSAKAKALNGLRADINARRWMARDTRYVIVIDLEALCWADGKAPKGADQCRQNGGDIIEIGLVVLDTVELKVVEERSILTKPRTALKISKYCTDLTSLTQTMLDEEGVDLDLALAGLAAEFGNCAMASWGAYDPKQLTRAYRGRSFLNGCEGQSKKHPFGDTHYNVRHMAALLTGDGEADLKATAEAMGCWSGHHHRGIDDARAIAGILAKLLGAARGAF